MALREISKYFITFIRDLLGRQSYQRFREREDRRRRLLAQFFTILTMVIGIYYLIWHYFYINWHIWFIAVPFYSAEIIGLVLFLVFP